MSTYERSTYLGVWVLLCLLALAVASVALAHDKMHPANDEWLKELKSDDGTLCCDGNDVIFEPRWRIVSGDLYQVALTGDDWQTVPRQSVVSAPNRDGMAKVWPKAGPTGMAVRCFQPGGMG